MFWNLVFPIGLGILFACTFGNAGNMMETLEPIDIAYVEDQPADEEFETILEEMDKADEPLIILHKMDQTAADKALKDEEVVGTFVNSSDITLYVKEEGINQSILTAFLNQYQSTSSTIAEVAAAHPENLEAVIAAMNKDMGMIAEAKEKETAMPAMIEYFYALIAMSCLYGCYMGLACAVETKADMSPLASRRVVASTNRFVIMLADLLSSLTVQFAISMFSVFVLKYALNIELGDNLPMIALVVFIGDLIGITFGLFVGSLGRGSENVKTAITMAIVMLCSFLSGLMVGNMYYVIEDICPLLNRINPASLIVDSLYSLSIYDNYEQFSKNMTGLVIMAVLLTIGSFAAIRRERYASI